LRGAIFNLETWRIQILEYLAKHIAEAAIVAFVVLLLIALRVVTPWLIAVYMYYFVDASKYVHGSIGTAFMRWMVVEEEHRRVLNIYEDVSDGVRRVFRLPIPKRDPRSPYFFRKNKKMRWMVCGFSRCSVCGHMILPKGIPVIIGYFAPKLPRGVHEGCAEQLETFDWGHKRLSAWPDWALRMAGHKPY
jgi:hypothetical protein